MVVFAVTSGATYQCFEDGSVVVDNPRSELYHYSWAEQGGIECTTIYVKKFNQVIISDCDYVSSIQHLSRVMRKLTFCICKTKDADQLRGNHEADQRLCFRYTDSAMPLLSKSEIFKSLAIFCRCVARFVSYQVGNQNFGFLMTRLFVQPAQIQTDLLSNKIPGPEVKTQKNNKQMHFPQKASFKSIFYSWR